MKTTRSKTSEPDPEAKYPRREARRRRTRETILAVARDLFRSRGFDAVKMTDIAEAADIHVTTLFIHFGAKRDLADALADIEVEALQAAIARAQGVTPFFAFFRGLVGEWAKEVVQGRRDGAVLNRDVRANAEAAARWLGHYNREVALYARYFAADYGLDVDEDLLPYLVASMLAGGNVVVHDRWLRSEGRADLLHGALEAIDICQQMVEAIYGTPDARRAPANP